MKFLINRSNLKKTYYYLKKNGLKAAFYAARERILDGKKNNYRYATLPETELAGQREGAGKRPFLFSILVPAYETDPVYLREMIDSVLGQTYERLELILVDAGRSDTVERTVAAYEDERIRYRRLSSNQGISANTGEALAMAKGEYVGLLDHDDLLTPDALYRMAQAIEACRKEKVTAKLLYSDEDKGNGDCTVFSEPHRKPGLNMELLLSNNYICHFLVMRRELMQRLKFRSAYDGAQDYDLILRAAGELREEREAVVHIPRVLYHWRCHEGSTAHNPESKRYAYEAGRRALTDFVQRAGWNARVEELRHLGFYRVVYEPDVFACRPEVGVTGGRLLDRHNRITGGIYDEEGHPLYIGLHREYSGYMHRASLTQEAFAVDVRHMRVRKELWGVFEESFGVPYKEQGRERLFDWSLLERDRREQKVERAAFPDRYYREKSLAFCRRVHKAGYLILWDPV